jgi:hypothetical protein
MKGIASLLARDLRLALRLGGGGGIGVAFFVLAVVLIPLGVGRETATLARIAGGVLWIAALLASLLSLDRIFQADFEDGSLDQGGRPLADHRPANGPDRAGAGGDAATARQRLAGAGHRHGAGHTGAQPDRRGGRGDHGGRAPGRASAVDPGAAALYPDADFRGAGGRAGAAGPFPLAFAGAAGGINAR